MAQFLGNKVEMAITKAVEGNKSLLKVGLHFEFGDCRYYYYQCGETRIFLKCFKLEKYFVRSIFVQFFKLHIDFTEIFPKETEIFHSL